MMSTPFVISSSGHSNSPQPVARRISSDLQKPISSSDSPSSTSPSSIPLANKDNLSEHTSQFIFTNFSVRRLSPDANHEINNKNHPGTFSSASSSGISSANRASSSSPESFTDSASLETSKNLIQDLQSLSLSSEFLITIDCAMEDVRKIIDLVSGIGLSSVQERGKNHAKVGEFLKI